MKNSHEAALRIRLAAITILGLFIVLAAAAYLGGRQVELSSQLLDRDAVPGTIDAHFMRMAMSRSIGWVMVAASAQTTQSRDASLKIVHDADEAFADYVKQYETTIRIDPAKDRALLDRVKRGYAEYYRQRMAYEALILAGDRDGSAVFLERDLVPAYLPAIKSAEELLNYNHANSITYANYIHNSVRQLHWMVAVVVVLALICASVLIVNLSIRRREMMELRESEEKFAKAFRLNPSGISITEMETGEYMEVNESFCRIMGYSPQELIGCTSVELRIWSGVADRKQVFASLLDGNMLRNLELQTRTRDGESKTVLVNAELIEWSGKKCILSLVQDITERKQAEQQLRASEELFRTSFESATVGVCLVARDGRFLKVNRTMCDMLGYAKEELLQLTFNDVTHEEDQEIGLTFLGNTLSGGPKTMQVEKRYLHKDGRVVWAFLSTALIEQSGEHGGYLISYVQDITERKRAVEQIEMLKVSVDQHFDAAFWMDTSNRFVYVNDSACKALGYTREELLGQAVSMVAPTATPQNLEEIWKHLRQTGFFRRESVHRRKDGSEFPIEIVASYVRFEGKEFNCGFARDITERKRAEQAVTASEAALKEAQKLAHIGSSAWDARADKTSWSDEFYRIVGRDPAMPPPTHEERTKIYTPDSFAILDRAAKRALATGEPYDLQLEIVRPDGEHRQVYARGTCTRDESGGIIGLHGTLQDITELKQLEQKQVELAAIVASSDDAIIGKSLTGIITSWNRGAEKIFGYSAAEAVGQPLLMLIPGDRHHEEADILEKIGRGEAVEHYETVRIRKDGRRIDISATISPLKDGLGKVVGASKIARDITERKQAEERLKLFRALVDHANDAIEIIDPLTGRFLDVNEKASVVHGYSREEYTAFTIADLDPKFAALGEDGLKAHVSALREKGFLIFETEHRRKDGSIFPVEINASYIRLERDYMLAVVRDITERQRTEQHIRRLNRLYAVLSGINTLIVRERNPGLMMQAACRTATETGGFRMAWIGMLDEATQVVKPVASAGVVDGYLDTIDIDLKSAARSAGPTGRAVLTGEHQLSNDFAADSLLNPWRDAALQRGYRSATAFPLRVAGQVVGVFTLYSEEKHFFDSDELLLLDELARDIGFALEVNQKEIERQQAEEATRQSEAKFATAFRSVPSGLAITELESGRYIEVNESFCRMMGFSPQEVIGRTTVELGIWGSVKEREKLLAPLLAGDSVRNFEMRARSRDKTDKTVLVNADLIEFAGKTCVLSLLQDITESTRTRAALAELQRHHERALTSLGDGLQVIDREGRIIFQNPAAAALLGWSGRELIGQRGHAVIHHSRADGAPYPEEECKIYASLRDGEPRRVEDEVFWRRDGTSFPVAYICTAIRNEAGEIVEVVIAFRDITDQKRTEEKIRLLNADLERRVQERTTELSIANARLEQISQHKDEFLANMSHELRTPLNAILGLSEALLEQVSGSLTARQVKSLTTISSSGSHLLALINDILDLSKVEAGRMELHPEPLNVTEFCETCLVFVRSQAMQKRLEVNFEYDGGPASFRADPKRFKQVLVNLLTNAVKFTPEGGRIGLSVAAVPGGEEMVSFTVWDTGIGIAPADTTKLFQAFTQIDSGLSRTQEGTGLGLALVARLVDLHGGSVALETEPGKGSRFTVTIPGELRDAKSPASRAPVMADSKQFQQIIRRALIVDDDSTSSDQLVRYLEEVGISSSVFTLGGEIVDAAARERPDIILLDIMLPDESGWVTLVRLKEHPNTQTIPVVIVSVVDEPEKAQKLGAAAHFTKPVSREQLAKFLQRFANQNQKPAPQPAALENSGPAILLAEDNEANVQTIGGYLEQKGYAMHYASNGLIAVQLARELRPALVLMDIQMPVMDGLTAIQEFRKDATLRAIPIIALTALAMPGDSTRCLEAGADDYVSKPVRLKQLDARIRRRLNMEEASGSR